MQAQRLRCSLLLLTTLAATLAAGAVAPSGSRVHPLFLSGAPAPSGLTFASFGRAATNARGSLCFLAGWDGVGRRRAGLYLQRAGELLPVVRAGDPVPGGGGERFSFPAGGADEFSAFSLNDRDEVAFLVRQGLFLYSEGEVRPIARVGETVPGYDGQRWDEVRAVSLSNSGRLAFIAAIRSVSDGERLEGLFQSAEGRMEIVLFVGDTIPGLEGELAVFGGVDLNERGQIASLVWFGIEQQSAVLLTSEGTTQAIAVQGESGPDGVWADLSSAAINERGEVAFQAQVDGPDGEWTGIYRAAGAAVAKVAAPGMDLADGRQVGDFLGRPVLDDQGRIAFVAALSGDNQPQALVIAAEERLTAVATVGQPAAAGEGTVRSFTGLNRGGLHQGRLVGAMTRGDDATGDAIVSFQPGNAPKLLLSTQVPLPAGSVLMTVDDGAAPRETQAHLTDPGEVVFAATVGGYGRTLFQLKEQGPELLAPLGPSAHDPVGLRSVVSFTMNETGWIVFLGHRDEAGEDTAVYVTSLDSREPPRVVVASGTPVPGEAGRVITRLGPPRIDGRGRVFVTAQSVALGEEPGTAAVSDHLLLADGERLEAIASGGMRVPGIGTLSGYSLWLADGSLSTLFRELQVNAGGDALYLASFQQEQTDIFHPSGLFSHTEQGMQPIALIGQRAPLADGSLYNSFSLPRLGEEGTLTFAASLVGAGRRPRTGLFRVQDGVTTTLAVTGDPAPGLAEARYRSLLEPAMNAAGDLAFLALLDGPPEVRRSSILYVSRGAETRPVPSTVDEPQGAALRLDDAAPPAPLTLLNDGRLLIAARTVEGGSSGLFLLEPQ